jgi:hypothetical protein
MCALVVSMFYLEKSKNNHYYKNKYVLLVLKKAKY